MRDRAKPITADERRGAHREGAATDGRAEARRDHPRRRHLAGLLHRHPLGQQRAAVRGGHPARRQPVRRLPGLRRGPRARAARARPAGAHRRARPGRRTRARSSASRRDSRTAASPPAGIGVEETTKFVFADSIARAAPALKVASATPVTAGCRMIKDAHEVELMRLACEATLKCYEAVFKALQPGMTQNQVGALINAGVRPARVPRRRQRPGRRVHGAAARLDRRRRRSAKARSS